MIELKLGLLFASGLLGVGGVFELARIMRCGDDQV